MAPPKQTVCIVGAGQSGLAALKESILQGMEPICYDLDSDIGGLWHKKETYENSNTASVWQSLVSNNSKYTMSFSDFPPNPRDPVFFSAQQLHDYLKKAVKHFGMEKYIHLNTKVVKVREAPDHDQTGKWEVYTCPSHVEVAEAQDLSQCKKETFDNVFICSGWYKKPYYPDIPGLKEFKGHISHSFTYSDPRPFDGKKVLVVGNKFSAAEVVTDVASLANETYLALGKGTWIVPRLLSGARIIDLAMHRNQIHSSDPEYEFNEFFMQEACGKMDHFESGVGCNENPSKSPWCISDDLPVKIASGKIKAYGHLTELKGSTAIFKEGESIQGLDAIIFCTGYRTELSFLDLKVHSDDGKMEMYMLAFPLNRKHNTLAVIGHYGTDGPMVVMGENQARLAASVMVGSRSLPSQKVMAQSVEFWNQSSSDRRPGYHNYMIPGFAFLDTMAVEGGFYPSFWKLMLRDPVLAWRTWYGPYLAAQYRLLGPGSQWEKAREICYTGYSEGLQCIRHADKKMVDRPDLRRRRKTRTVRLLGSSLIVVGIVVFRMWRKGEFSR
ncbi:dimethylaniline monooxygenase [N-oxide-forming] [Elysia marginata]|uniref:Flavin-containing monooxygenase n=1 Tax=Elysia marginata TaxID=1093978 RepID=A0AAV4E9G2_9GAST|nr:dimethylaniline monooxygenase [N-oxide-forming] [Elysia marginata]